MAKQKPWKLAGFDSEEELHFSFWLEEAERAGYIQTFYHHPLKLWLSQKQEYTEIVELKTKSKAVRKHLLHKHTYQPDFWFYPTDKFFCLCHGMKGEELNYGMKYANQKDTVTPGIYVDIKGGFQPQHSKAEAFSVNQKWIYQVHRTMIHKIIPEKFFKKTWVPEKCAYWVNGKRRIAKYAGCKLLEDLA